MKKFLIKESNHTLRVTSIEYPGTNHELSIGLINRKLMLNSSNLIENVRQKHDTNLIQRSNRISGYEQQ